MFVDRETTPLLIAPLTKYRSEDRSNEECHILHRLVSQSPNPDHPEAEIETVIEAIVSPNGETLWRRVVVRSGPTCPKQVTHASYTLPKGSTVESDFVLCWASFPERPNHKLLCVLASPTLLCIWDVYPSGKEADLSGEGHSIPLPFEACAIHAIGEQHGLVLQRKNSLEDHKSWVVHGQQAEEEEDGFFLKAPPRPVRLGDVSGTSIGGMSTPAAANPVPSLFSLSHPLDDVLPISLLSDAEAHHGIVTDVFEKILFIGMLRWTDQNLNAANRQEYSKPICVTYHTHHKRHAIWEVNAAPPPPPQQTPLWQVSRQWRADNGWNSHLGVLQQDLEDFELLGIPEAEASQYDTTTRNEALADALGVRKTPRKAVEDMAPRARGTNSRSRQRSKNSGSNAHTSLLSPLSRHFNEAPTFDVDMSTESEGRVRPQLQLGPFSSLHPSIAIKCLYAQKQSCSQALDVFLSSNLEGSGTLVLCLLCQVDGQSNPIELQQFVFEPSQSDNKQPAVPSGTRLETNNGFFSVKGFQSLPIIWALPIQASPIPPCFRPHPSNSNSDRQNVATDIVVLVQDDSGASRLSLYRANVHVVDCALPPSVTGSEGSVSTEVVRGIANPVNDRFDLLFVDEINGTFNVRGSLSMIFKSCVLCEKTLQAVDAAMITLYDGFNPKPIELALKLRADCVRLQQKLRRAGHENSLLVEEVNCSAVDTAISTIFAQEMFRTDGNVGCIDNSASPAPVGTAWESLLQSEFHRHYTTEDCDSFLSSFTSVTPLTAKTTHPGSMSEKWSVLRDQYSSIYSQSVDCIISSNQHFSSAIFDALHLLYEDFKLSANSKSEAGLKFIGSILGRACLIEKSLVSSRDDIHTSIRFINHYQRDLGKEWFKHLEKSFDTASMFEQRSRSMQVSLSTFSSPPCILTWIDRLIKGQDDGGIYSTDDHSTINAACSKTRSLLRILSTLFSNNDSGVDGSEHKSDWQCNRDHNIVTALIEEGFATAATVRDELPVGVALPLLEVLHRCRGDPAMAGVTRLDASAWSLIGREDLCKNLQNTKRRYLDTHVELQRSLGSVSLEQTHDQNSFEDVERDGIVPLELTSSMLFPNDNRIREVGRLLRSSRPSFLSVPRAIEVSDHNYERMKQDKLLLLSRRVLALPVGRGMLTIGNLQPVPAEPLPLPDLCLVGRVPPTNAMLALDATDCPQDLKVWPEFHNGVAAGLRLPLDKDSGEDISKITRTWIVYNRPPRNNQSHPQSGPNGANNSQNLGHSHGGLLMALGLRGHLTTLEMTDIFDYLTQGTVTTTVGVLLGMAANMRGSCDVSVSKMLCLHIPSLIPQHFSAIDVASPVQAAAVAGAGLLYQRSSHRMMTEFLLNEIGKRPANDVNAFDREAYTLSCGIALGMVNLCQGERLDGKTEVSGSAGLADLRIEERLYRYVVGGLDDAEMHRRRDENDRLSLPSASASSNNEKCSCVYEGESINTDITAPGATLALGLIYMKSGNKTMASTIALPDTHFLLEYVRPDFLMLRVIARALILWDEVRPSKSWIEAQLPSVVQKAYQQMRATAKKTTDISMDPRSPQNPATTEMKAGISSSHQAQDYDRQAVRQIYAHVVAGACFGIGLRFAGTGDRHAAEAIFERVMELKSLRDANDPVAGALRPAGPVLEMCLGCAAISLAMVLAGTGDLETLKLLKILRWRCDEDVNYGTHMTYGAAIGLLFVGGGSCTLGREPEDIAALVTAFYPRYPSTTSDNQYHLQALRNLYALAVKHRELRAVDVDTGESVFVPVEICFANDSAKELSLTAPCLLYNTKETPRKLRVVSERYYPLTLDLGKPPSGRTFFVKKRSAHLSYRQDPEAQRSLLVQTGSFRGGAFLDLVASFTEDPKVLAFAQYLCDDSNSSSKQGAYGPFSIAGFCTRVLHECLTLDTEEALPLYLALRSAIAAVKAGSSSALRCIWDFRLIRSYYEERRRVLSYNGPRLLNFELVTYLNELVETAFVEGGMSRKPSTLTDTMDGRQKSCCIATYYDVPLDVDISDKIFSGSEDSMDTSL